MKEKNYVYVMTCPSFPHLVKIVFSEDCEGRILNLTSSPTPFKIEEKWLVENARNLEKTIHKALSFCRISTSREFFGISADKAISAINTILKTGVFENEDLDRTKSRRVENCKSVGRLIRYERERQGLTQRQVAFACGTGLRIIGDIERGKATTQIGKVFEVLKILRIEVFALQP